MSSVEESNARHAEYRAAERRNNITMMAKRMMVLQIGHHGGLWGIDDGHSAEQHEVFRKMSRQAFSAATAFYEELTVLDTDPITGKGGA